MTQRSSAVNVILLRARVALLVLACVGVVPTASCGEPPRRATATAANAALAMIWRVQSALRSDGTWDLPVGSVTPAATAGIQEASAALAFPLWQAGAVWELHASDGATSPPTLRWQIRVGRQRFFYFDVAVADSGSIITGFGAMNRRDFWSNEYHNHRWAEALFRPSDFSQVLARCWSAPARAPRRVSNEEAIVAELEAWFRVQESSDLLSRLARALNAAHVEPEVSQISAKDGLLEYQLVTIGSAPSRIVLSALAIDQRGVQRSAPWELRTLQVDEDVASGGAPRAHEFSGIRAVVELLLRDEPSNHGAVDLSNLNATARGGEVGGSAMEVDRPRLFASTQGLLKRLAWPLRAGELIPSERLEGTVLGVQLHSADGEIVETMEFVTRGKSWAYRGLESERVQMKYWVPAQQNP